MSRLPDVYASSLEQIADRIRQHRDIAQEKIIEIGRDLIEAKRLLPHGQFLPWVAKELMWGERTAQQFMRIAEVAQTRKFSDLPKLSVSALYTLASLREPDKVIPRIVDRAKAGEKITAATIRLEASPQPARVSKPMPMTLIFSAGHMLPKVREEFEKEADKMEGMVSRDCSAPDDLALVDRIVAGLRSMAAEIKGMGY
jgi:hypothetical protein